MPTGVGGTQMDSFYGRTKGFAMFILMAIAIVVIVFGKGWSFELQNLFDYLQDKSLFHVGTPITFVTFKWTLTAIVVNLVTIVFAIIDIMIRRDRRPVDIIVAAVLGGLIVFHIFAFPISITEFDFNWVVIVTYTVYLVTDFIGMWMTGTGDHPEAAEYPVYYYPACCLDGPTFAVTGVFLSASWLAPVTKDFYDGIGAGILLLSGLVYAGLLGFVIPERTIRVPLHTR
jgi:hypothetical protein